MTSFEPVSAMQIPPYAAIPTFMRLPLVEFDSPLIAEVDIGLIGVPWDGGTTNRPGTRHGPRHVRDCSTMIRNGHPVSSVQPFEMFNCADLGDVAVPPVGLREAMDAITAFFAQAKARGITPLSVGGDHLTTLPILRSLAADEPVGLIQFDSHPDVNDECFGGQKYTHGTPFRRAIEEGLIDPKRYVQIGIRGTRYDYSDIIWAREQGVTVFEIEEVFARGIEDIMAETLDIVGAAPTFCTFDIDFIDVSYAPGTGTPEIGGPTSFQAQQAVRGLEGVNLIGADMVEVSPPFDPSGVTGWTGASIVFELLCVLAQARAAR